MIPDNPASRYHDILEEVLGGNPKAAFRDAWARALQTSNSKDLVMTMAQVATLLPEIKANVATLPLYQQDRYVRNYLAWARPLIVFDVAGHTSWEREKIIARHELDALGMLGDLLSAHGTEHVLQEATANDLLTRVEKMISDIVNAENIEANSRAFMMQHLSRVADRLRHIKIYGRGGVEEALGRACLATLEIEDTVTRQGPTSRFARFFHSEHYQAFRGFLEDIARVLGIATGAFALAAGGQPPALPSAPTE